MQMQMQMQTPEQMHKHVQIGISYEPEDPPDAPRASAARATQ